MQASMACSLHVHGFNPLQSHTNHLPETTLRLKPPYYAFTQPRSPPSGITLRRNFQPQPLLNLCTPKVSSSKVSPLRCGILSNMYGGKENRGVGEWLVVASEVLSTAFPLWVSIGCVVGLMKPSFFNWVTPKLTIMGLNIVMLGMGMTLSIDDLRGALAMPKQVLYAFALQYSVSICTQ
ncbi:probable sodium/metabolite cotransporter BASS1, chloroplastic [Vigna unguiculata]|uniref:probable sodium/metabolite cotransporter BASS1, chloroplastic n=1 Tax=Vigna unguiculata TaxID=3917 RepID=UPI0010163EAB|nr:probable sodium/metabolite cotransporter BASS1, chloroplastic [Vigna unguiculata]